MKIDSFFTRHLRETGEGYFEHLFFTLQTACVLILGGLTILIHGLFPFVFVKTTGGLIERLYQRLMTRRAKRALPPA